jgi:hypothetical protein
MARPNSGGRPRRPRRWWVTAFIALACLFGVTEVAARVVLRITRGDGITVSHAETAPNFVYFSRMPWVYDRDRGYDYQPGARFLIGSINDGRFSGCTDLPHVNGDGTMGLPATDYPTAELKILIVGDETESQMPGWAGRTWPNIMQAKLQDLLHKKVALLNYARDGYALPQILEKAAIEAAARKPDLVVVAFTTTTLGRSKTWRSVGDIGGYPTTLVAATPNVVDEPVLGWPLGNVVDSKVTSEWCSSMSVAVQNRYEAALRTDRVTNDLIARYNVLSAFMGGSLPKRVRWSELRRSFLLDWVRHGDPLYLKQSAVDRPAIAGFSSDDFATDQSFAQSVARLRASKIRVLLLHVPLYPEIKDHKAWVASLSGLEPGRVDRLAQSLARSFDQPIVDMLDYAEYPVEDPLRYVNNPADFQLTAAGLEFYGDVAAKALAAKAMP